MIKAPPTPKGFRDILPELAKKRREVINTISNVLEESGFVPVETPTIEFAKTLKGKYGEEEKLIYEFTDRGGRDLALRYDLTVPLARFVASNLKLIEKGPFRRYQIGQVFSGEKPQKGRWREFTQLDFDSVGGSSSMEDVEIVQLVSKCLRKLGIENFTILINSREILRKSGASPEFLRVLDKQDKLSKDEFLKLVSEAKEYDSTAYEFLKNSKPEDDPVLKEIFKNKDLNLFYLPTLARGLDYYTGVILEVKIDGIGTIGGGGRYDNLIGMFAKRQIPAVGFSFGLDRLIDSLPDEIR